MSHWRRLCHISSTSMSHQCFTDVSSMSFNKTSIDAMGISEIFQCWLAPMSLRQPYGPYMDHIWPMDVGPDVVRLHKTNHTKTFLTISAQLSIPGMNAAGRERDFGDVNWRQSTSYWYRSYYKEIPIPSLLSSDYNTLQVFRYGSNESVQEMGMRLHKAA